MPIFQFSSFAALTRAAFTMFLALMLATSFQFAVTSDADAKKRKRYNRTKITKRARGNPKYAAYVIDAKTGKVLHSSSGHAKRYPASLTKMMTLYLIFEDLKAGRIKKSSRLVMTRAGAARPPSKLGLKPGQSISMEQVIYSLVTKSANDVATAIGDKLAGSEKRFAKRMTRKARQLGMKNTTFKNASGLTERGQLTTAADMAKLGLALREHFPVRYRYFQTRVFKLGKRRYKNHNKLLGRVRGVDGIKTGYTSASGFNLVSSVSSRNRRIVAVVMGGRSGGSRNAQMILLINRYLPKASRGGAKRLIARAKSSRAGNNAAGTSAISRKAGLVISSRIRGSNAAGIPNFKDINQIRESLVNMTSNTTPVPVLRKSLFIEKQSQDVASKKASNSRPKGVRGWQIQIAASENRPRLMEVLNEVKNRNRRLLSKKSLLMPKIIRNGNTFYRARFAGFASKQSAVNACKVLKKQRYECLAFNG